MVSVKKSTGPPVYEWLVDVEREYRFYREVVAAAERDIGRGLVFRAVYRGESKLIFAINREWWQCNLLPQASIMLEIGRIYYFSVVPDPGFYVDDFNPMRRYCAAFLQAGLEPQYEARLAAAREYEQNAAARALALLRTGERVGTSAGPRHRRKKKR